MKAITSNRLLDWMLAFLIVGGSAFVLSVGCNQTPAKTAAEVSSIASLTQDQIQCLESANGSAGDAIVQCLPGLVLDPNLIGLISELFEQKEAARKAGYVWRKDGG